MSILNQIPKPTINLDFVQMQENRNTLSALRSVVEQIPGSAVDFSALRASKKYTQNRLGLITEAPLNVPALSFDKGVAKGFLAEGGATNIAQKSEGFDDADFWVKARTTIETSNAINPRGEAESFLLRETTENNSHELLIEATKQPTVTSGLPYTGSFFVKKNSGVDIIQLTFNVGSHDPRPFANFNLATGVVTRQEGGIGAISNGGNGWYRVSFTATTTATVATSHRLIFTNNNPNANRQPSYVGSTDNTVLVQFAQLEQNSFASSYIPTTTATVARSADNFRITGASGAIGQTSGVVQVDVDIRKTKGGANNFEIFSISNNSNTNKDLRIFQRSKDSGTLPNAITFQVRNGALTPLLFNSNITTDQYNEGIVRFLFRMKPSNYLLSHNGLITATSADSTPFDLSLILNQILIGSRSALGFNDHIRSVRIWNSSDWCTDEIAKILTRP